ncbi:MAG: hypothetical protein ACYC28_06695 [Longimicrobiales bacterium]
MRVTLRHPARLAVALAFGFITASAAAAQEPAPQPQPAPAPAPAPDPQPAPEPTPAPEAPAPEKCELVVDAASVPVNAEPVTVRAQFSRAIGETVEAAIAPGSGITIVSAEPDAATPLTLALTLDTSAANAGDWAIQLQGEDGQCAGSIAVMPATPPPSR